MDNPILAPNTSPFPSAEWNNPEFAPFLQPGADFLRLSQVPAEAAVYDPTTDRPMMAQSAPNNLAALRLMFPYMEIVPFPARALSVALTQNVATDVNLPSSTVAVIMRGNNDYYVCRAGKADIPTATNESQSIYKPEGYIMYVAGMRQLSVIAPNAGTIVTFMLYQLTPMQPC